MTVQCLHRGPDMLTYARTHHRGHQGQVLSIFSAAPIHVIHYGAPTVGRADTFDLGFFKKILATVCVHGRPLILVRIRQYNFILETRHLCHLDPIWKFCLRSIHIIRGVSP